MKSLTAISILDSDRWADFILRLLVVVTASLHPSPSLPLLHNTVTQSRLANVCVRVVSVQVVIEMVKYTLSVLTLCSLWRQQWLSAKTTLLCHSESGPSDNWLCHSSQLSISLQRWSPPQQFHIYIYIHPKVSSLGLQCWGLQGDRHLFWSLSSPTLLKFSHPLFSVDQAWILRRSIVKECIGLGTEYSRKLKPTSRYYLHNDQGV